jgi:hypothetical protein
MNIIVYHIRLVFMISLHGPPETETFGPLKKKLQKNHLIYFMNIMVLKRSHVFNMMTAYGKVK